MSDEEKLKAIETLVRSQSTLALSTVDAQGLPHAAPLFYLMGPGLELYWLSSSSSVHSRNLAADPRVAAAIYAPTERWNEICGVQIRGTASKITGRSLRRNILQEYRERFHLGNMFRLAIARSSLYVLRPQWIRYLDNTRHFGFKFEISFSTPQVQEKH